MNDVPPPLVFTGERYHPELPREIAYEHWHRYAFATALTSGCHVLDAACGEGYGANLLARTAASVIGIDLSAQAIAHASARYLHPNLRFQQGDVLMLDGIAAASMDRVISFETLEHLGEQDRLLEIFARVLKPDGLLLISTPDRHVYTDLSGQQNPHHVRELYREEFEALLKRHFPHFRLYGQRVVAQSMLWQIDGNHGALAAYTQDGDGLHAGLQAAPMYYLAVCAQQAAALPELPAISCFSDRQQSVFEHYQQVIRDLLATDRYALTLRQRLRKAGLPDGP